MEVELVATQPESYPDGEIVYLYWYLAVLPEQVTASQDQVVVPPVVLAATAGLVGGLTTDGVKFATQAMFVVTVTG